MNGINSMEKQIGIKKKVTHRLATVSGLVIHPGPRGAKFSQTFEREPPASSVFLTKPSQGDVEPTVATPGQNGCQPQYGRESRRLRQPSYSQPPCGWHSGPPPVGYE